MDDMLIASLSNKYKEPLNCIGDISIFKEDSNCRNKIKKLGEILKEFHFQFKIRSLKC